MKGWSKFLGLGLMLIGLLIAVPVAAIALNVAGGSSDGSTGAVKTSMPNMMGATTSATAAPAADQLTIVHMQKGCHDWSNGTSMAAHMQLALKPGQMLRITNQDVDMHRVMQLSGPAMSLAGPLREGQAETLKFPQPGTYRFDTKVLPMKGMPEVETVGPDNHLELTVTVG